MIKIYVEGKSDKFFLDALCKEIKIDEFETISVGSNNFSLSNLELVKSDINDKRVEKIYIVFDADNDYQKTKTNLEQQLINLQKIKIFLLPNNKDNGELEDLLKKIAKHPCFIICFEEYINCLKNKGNTNLNKKELNKNLIYSYNQACGNRIKNICLEHYNLDHEYIEPLIDFLKA
ncbi:DUF3226 domain-containing protein [Campylobacter sp. CNRCH_2016_0050h]|uniref:DUF3226 domain-containing protein n=1 Tax=Campylobacter sp. CNRCH_2016_0050h TaxID=2911608 RepID=UPI0021E65720|nr:DUF3226 domain-containing protein [Campylobacter sp. CNRCH_2016_0050h]MCV3456605.1 hypothetical protein [Campylobacter sp. CNRCH_2016_0050h]